MLIPCPHRNWIAASLALALASATTGDGGGDMCLAAARRAAAEHDVPPAVMSALTLTETGRGRGATAQPWPWAVNLGGESHWPPTRSAASDLVAAALAQDRRNIDIGCFQINYRWHGAAFASVDSMLDPDQNAAYAARFLVRLWQQKGSWTAAVGAYHSSDPDLASRYLARFDAVLAETAQAVDEAPLLTNAFPLLRAGMTGRGASLVPATVAGRRLIGE